MNGRIYSMAKSEALKTFLANNKHRIRKDEELNPKPQNWMKPWTEQDETWLKYYFKQNVPPQNIALGLNRTTFAVECRLVKLGLWDANGKPTMEIIPVKPGYLYDNPSGSKERPYQLGKLRRYIEGYEHNYSDWSANLADALKCLAGSGKYIIDGNGTLHQATTALTPKKDRSYYSTICAICGQTYGQHRYEGDNCPDNFNRGWAETKFQEYKTSNQIRSIMYDEVSTFAGKPAKSALGIPRRKKLLLA